jgi:diketogulonate reductase-like aldo/keto reductase
LLRNPQLARIASAVHATPAQIALAWLLQKDRVIAIPQTSDIAHVIENRRAASLRLSAAVLAKLDAAFPPPSHAQPLAVI